MANLFGFSFDDEKKKGSGKLVSPVPPSDADESDFYVQSGFYGQYLDTDGVYKTEFDLIKRYREMSHYPECDSAVEDIVNEAIVSDTDDSPIEIELSNLNASDKLKDLIYAEFKNVKELLNFDRSSHEIFRNWYIDGRILYHKVIDFKNPEQGIQELRPIDPLDIRYVRKKKQLDPKTQVIQKTLAGAGSLDELESEIEEYYEYTIDKGKHGRFERVRPGVGMGCTRSTVIRKEDPRRADQNELTGQDRAIVIDGRTAEARAPDGRRPRAPAAPARRVVRVGRHDRLAHAGFGGEHKRLSIAVALGPLARLGQAAARAEAADGEGQEGRAEAPDRPALVEDDPGAVLGVEPALARRLVAVLVHERLGTRVGILARATPGVVGRPRPALHHLLAFRVDVRDLHQALVAMLAGEVVHVGAIGVAGAMRAALKILLFFFFFSFFSL